MVILKLLLMVPRPTWTVLLFRFLLFRSGFGMKRGKPLNICEIGGVLKCRPAFLDVIKPSFSTKHPEIDLFFFKMQE